MTQQRPNQLRTLETLRQVTYRCLSFGGDSPHMDTLLTSKSIDRGDHVWHGDFLTDEGRDVADDIREGLADATRLMEALQDTPGVSCTPFGGSCAEDRWLYLVLEAAMVAAIRGECDAPEGEVVAGVCILLRRALERARGDCPDEKEAIGPALALSHA